MTNTEHIEETKSNTEVDSTSKSNESEKSDSDDKYQEGQELTFIRVRFPGNARSQPFLLGKRKFVYGQKVLAMSDRGMTVGYINSFPYTVNFDKSMLPIRTIAKVATDEDIQEQKSFMQKEKEAEVLCIRLIEKHNLDMNVTHVEFIQFGKKAVFYFNAPERVDFRGLVKDLVGDLKMRIELRQISVRDRAAALGAIGACGLQTCCSSFLSNYGNVSIKMAKNQNLALIPSKINGVCGQVKCCIKYEDDVYTEKRKLLPHEQSFIRAKNGDTGKVIKLHLMQEQFDMLTDKGYIRRYAKNQYEDRRSLPPKGWEFPTQFRSIVQETSTVIGISDEEEKILGRYVTEIESDDDDGQSAEIILDDDGDTLVIDDTPIESNFKHDDKESSDEKEARPRNNNRNRNNRNRNRNNNRNNGGESNQAQGQNQNQNHGNRPKQNAAKADGEDGANKKTRSRRPFNKNRNNKPKPE